MDILYHYRFGQIKIEPMAAMQTVPVLKDARRQQPVPSVWRPALCAIAQALKEGDFGLTRNIAGVRPVEPDTAAIMAGNIARYGARLASLPEETWQTSVCQWMGGYWGVLVDLYTEEEGCSDLVLDARVFEEGPAYVFDVHLVYVP